MSGLDGVSDIQNKNDDNVMEETLKTDFSDAVHRLDEMKIDEDLEISEVTNNDEGEEDDSDTMSQGARSSASDVTEDRRSVSSRQSLNSRHSVGSKHDESPKEDSKSENGKKEEQAGKDKKKRGSVFDKLKRLTKFDKSKNTPVPAPSSKFQTIRVDKLPQIFVAKYLGKKEVKGLFGLHHVRKPVDELVKVVKDGLLANEKVELPLTYVVISGRGIDIREHKSNTVKDKVTYGLIPIDFISYGVQDLKYWKVFTFIVVNQLSSRARDTECHAYLCDSAPNCRRMALSLGASFNVHKQKLASQGKAHNFQVELRPPDELAQDFEKDCEA